MYIQCQMWGSYRRYRKGHTTKPLWNNFIILDETYTCIFCKKLKFCESKCGACLFTIFGHLLSSKYCLLVVHVDLYNHPSVKGYSREALDLMNQMMKTHLEDNLIASLKAISCKLVQLEFS
jgi:hypothetical protein